LHDTVWFEIQGRVFVEHPIQDATDDEMRAKADDVFEYIVKALLKDGVNTF